MPSGITSSGSLAESIPLVIASARVVREHEGVMPQRVDRQTLEEGTGTTWYENRLEQLNARTVDEGLILDDPQQYVDSRISADPNVVGIHTIVTNKARRRLSKKVTALMGKQGMEAIQRKKDEDGLTQLDSFSVSLGGAGTTMQFGLISAAVARIKGNATEPSTAEISAVLHPFQIKDIQDELVAGVGTYVVDAGISAETFRNGFSGSVAGAMVFGDGNMAVDSADDAKGGVFSREAIILVEGHSPVAYSRFRPDVGGGADEMFMYDEYVYLERRDEWGYEIYTDVTSPSN